MISESALGTEDHIWASNKYSIFTIKSIIKAVHGYKGGQLSTANTQRDVQKTEPSARQCRHTTRPTKTQHAACCSLVIGHHFRFRARYQCCQ